MMAFRAYDDPQRGAPYSLCPLDDPVRLLAPNDVIPVPGSVPPSFSLLRSDYFWLALSLSAIDEHDQTMETVFLGTHTLTWPAMHAVLQTALAAGFSVPVPSDFTNAVKAALFWSLTHHQFLRRVSAADFEPLPPPTPAVADSWWLKTTFAAWQTDGLMHSACHMIGFAGRFWDAPSRDAQSRFHLSLTLTQEFVPVSPSLPPSLYGDPAIQFYMSTMPPPQLLLFPSLLSKLHSMLAFRWNYHHGGAAHLHEVLMVEIPIALKECVLLARFLSPALNAAAQVAAYRLIANTLAPALEAHRYETFRHINHRLANYVGVADRADAQEEPVFAETRSLLLQQAVEDEKRVLAAAPVSDTQSVKNEFSGSATQSIVTTLFSLRAKPDMVELEKRLRAAWSALERNPIAVFREVLESRSVACVSVLFGNLTGVRGAGPMFTILEQAAADRLSYFSFYLSTPSELPARADQTLWYSYPVAIDNALRSADFHSFSKINLFELGAHIRQLRTNVEARSQDIPKPGQEFAPGMGASHLSLLNHVKVWLSALGFPLVGPASFDAMFNAYFDYCQHGVTYEGVRLDGHVKGMRLLYMRMLSDMHIGFQCFWSKKLQEYDQTMVVDSLFPQDGGFYGTMRQLMMDVSKVNDLSRLGVSFDTPRASDNGNKRKWQDKRAPGSSPASASATPPVKGAVGSFAWAVKEEGDHLVVGYTKYAKRPILDKLNVQASEFCLPAYLSWKGAEACPCSTEQGHEAHDSTFHVFTEQQLALRPSFEEEPYRLPQDASSPGPPWVRGGGRARGKGAGRDAANRGGRK